MKYYQFTEDEYIKLSTVTGVSVMDLQKLDSLGLLVNKLAVRMVFKSIISQNCKNNESKLS